MSPAFTRTNLLTYEPFLKHKAQVLQEKFSEAAREGTPVNLLDVYRYFAIDVVSKCYQSFIRKKNSSIKIKYPFFCGLILNFYSKIFLW